MGRRVNSTRVKIQFEGNNVWSPSKLPFVTGWRGSQRAFKLPLCERAPATQVTINVVNLDIMPKVAHCRYLSAILTCK